MKIILTSIIKIEDGDIDFCLFNEKLYMINKLMKYEFICMVRARPGGTSLCN